MRALLLSIGLFALSFSSFAATDTAALRINADTLVAQKKYGEAEAIYTGILKTDSTRADIYSRRAMTYSNDGKYQEAYNDYSKALSLHPDDPYLYEDRGDFLLMINMQDEAASDFSTAIVFAKDPVMRRELYDFRSSARALKRDFDGALADVEKVLSEDSLNLGALIGISHYLVEMKRVNDALVYGQKAVRHYPDDARLYNNLALIYVELGRYNEALEINNKAVKLDKEPALPYNNRGFVKYKLNDLEGALADINKSLELYPTNSFALKNRALVYIAQNKTDLACKDLKEAQKQAFKSMYGDEVDELMAKYCK